MGAKRRLNGVKKIRQKTCFAAAIIHPQRLFACESVPCNLPQLKILNSLQELLMRIGEGVSRADRVGHVVLDEVPELLDKDTVSQKGELSW